MVSDVSVYLSVCVTSAMVIIRFLKQNIIKDFVKISWGWDVIVIFPKMDIQINSNDGKGWWFREMNRLT